jgi:hypothetical protein
MVALSVNVVVGVQKQGLGTRAFWRLDRGNDQIMSH